MLFHPLALDLGAKHALSYLHLVDLLFHFNDSLLHIAELASILVAFSYLFNAPIHRLQVLLDLFQVGQVAVVSLRKGSQFCHQLLPPLRRPGDLFRELREIIVEEALAL